MQPFMDKLLALGKDERKLKGDASDEEPPKRQKTCKPAPPCTLRRKKGNKKQVTLPDPVQMDLSQVNDDFIQREAGASTLSIDSFRFYVCALQIDWRPSWSKNAKTLL